MNAWGSLLSGCFVLKAYVEGFKEGIQGVTLMRMGEEQEIGVGMTVSREVSIFYKKVSRISVLLMTALVPWFFSPSALAFELKDQFGNSHEFSAGEGQILFAADMKAYKLLKSAMAKLQEPKSLLEGKKIFVVADISGMPGFISKYVSIPKMKELNYSIYLDATGRAVKLRPHEEGQILLLKGDETGAWQVQQKFKTDKELSQFLSEG